VIRWGVEADGENISMSSPVEIGAKSRIFVSMFDDIHSMEKVFEEKEALVSSITKAKNPTCCFNDGAVEQWIFLPTQYEEGIGSRNLVDVKRNCAHNLIDAVVSRRGGNVPR
jgi:hypothetical protein